jgi:Copper amine oxidase N-terminal domain
VKSASTALLAALIAAAGTVSAIAAPSSGGQGLAQAGSPPAANFGTPPSGQIPILYNDHHVYTKPDVLKQGRVLAALVKNGTLLIPLRSMFEQMGATVSYDAGTKTATVSKPGAEVKVTVGKPEVMINGESRPLDVPPIIYQGNVLVPVRVMSEGMGAYVLWVADKHLVVVRYLPATPPPSPVPTEAPTPPPTPAPTPKPEYKDIFVAGDYIISPKVYNQFANGAQGNGSWTVRGGMEFNLGNIPFMIEADYRNWQYPHNCGVPENIATPGNAGECFVTAIGSRFSTYVPAFTAVNRDVDVRLGVRIFNPRVYIGIGYIWGSNNFGYPNMEAVGGGIEKLPDLDQAFSFYGSVYYYPNFRGTYTNTAITPPFPTSYGVGYNLLKYQVGIDWVVFGPVYLDGGWMGENGANKNNAPISYNFNGPYVGLGFKF